MAWAGESKVAKNPSPVGTTSLPLHLVISFLNKSLWRSRRSRHFRSPIDAARSVEVTMSVNRMVFKALSG